MNATLRLRQAARSRDERSKREHDRRVRAEALEERRRTRSAHQAMLARIEQQARWYVEHAPLQALRFEEQSFTWADIFELMDIRPTHADDSCFVGNMIFHGDADLSVAYVASFDYALGEVPVHDREHIERILTEAGILLRRRPFISGDWTADEHALSLAVVAPDRLSHLERWFTDRTAEWDEIVGGERYDRFDSIRHYERTHYRRLYLAGIARIRQIRGI